MVSSKQIAQHEKANDTTYHIPILIYAQCKVTWGPRVLSLKHTDFLGDRGMVSPKQIAQMIQLTIYQS